MDDQNTHHPKSPLPISLEFVPVVGMEFKSVEEAFDFYHVYSEKVGFSVRLGSSHKRKDGTLKDRMFLCSKQGKKEYDKRRERSRKLPETREGCEACMAVTLQDNGKYKVKKFVEVHTHKCVTSNMVHLLRSHRKISKVQASQAKFARAVGTSPSTILAFQSKQVGGRECLGYLNVDLRNYLPHKREKAMEFGVAGAIAQYFERMQKENPSFYFAFQFDADDLLTNIFWADARMIVDYGHFGDVVTFDTTYRTNNYERPLALFLGVNHHNQTIVFGAALMYDESVDAYTWLFERFLCAMSRKKPITILTDQCAPMAKAIINVMPETSHHLCIWYIYQNAVTHLANVFNVHSSFKRDFTRCIYEYVDEEDLCRGWEKMLDDHDLRENTWLRDLFCIREKWAMVHNKQVFFARMNTFQRSESFSALTRRYLLLQLDPIRFLEQFQRVVEDIRYSELQQDFKMLDGTPTLFVPSPMLEAVVKIYTPTIFHEFQEQLKLTVCQEAFLVETNGSTRVYNVGLIGRNDVLHRVTYDASSCQFKCSCCMFEYAGIQCSHMMKIHAREGFAYIQPQYILKRWTINARLGEVKDVHGRVIDEDPRISQGRRYAELCHEFIVISTMAAESEEAYQLVCGALVKLKHDLIEMLRTQHVGRLTTNKV